MQEFAVRDALNNTTTHPEMPEDALLERKTNKADWHLSPWLIASVPFIG